MTWQGLAPNFVFLLLHKVVEMGILNEKEGRCNPVMAKSELTQTSFKTLLKTTAWDSFYWTANDSYYKLNIEERIQCSHCYQIWILTVTIN